MLVFSLVIKNSGKRRHHRRHGDTETSDLEYDKVSFSHLTTSQTTFRSLWQIRVNEQVHCDTSCELVFNVLFLERSFGWDATTAVHKHVTWQCGHLGGYPPMFLSFNMIYNTSWLA